MASRGDLMMIADTSFIIDVMTGKKESLKKLEEVERNDIPLNTTTITFFELWSGIEQSNKSDKEKEKIRDVLEARVLYDFDRIAGELGGRIDGKLSKKGKKVEPQDSMISGIAIRENEKILTRNTKHFNWISEVSDLNIEDYRSD